MLDLESCSDMRSSDRWCLRFIGLLMFMLILAVRKVLWSPPLMDTVPSDHRRKIKKDFSQNNWSLRRRARPHSSFLRQSIWKSCWFGSGALAPAMEWRCLFFFFKVPFTQRRAFDFIVEELAIPRQFPWQGRIPACGWVGHLMLERYGVWSMLLFRSISMCGIVEVIIWIIWHPEGL